MKNIQIVNKIIAREKGIKEELVEQINSFYWKEVRKKASNLESTSIGIKHIGTITTSKRKIDHFIKMTIKKIRNIRKSSTFKETTKEILLEINYNRLRRALIQRNILSKRYYEAYIERSKRVCGVNADNIQECGQDIRGNSESSKEQS